MVVGLCPPWVVLSPETRLGERRRKKISPSRVAVNIAPCCLYVWSAVCNLWFPVVSCLANSFVCGFAKFVPLCNHQTNLRLASTLCTPAQHVAVGKRVEQPPTMLTCRHVPCSWWVVCCTLDDVVKRTTPLLGELRFAVGGQFGAAVSV